jgi:hypothetical protein
LREIAERQRGALGRLVPRARRGPSSAAPAREAGEPGLAISSKRARRRSSLDRGREAPQHAELRARRRARCHRRRQRHDF